MKYLSTRGGMAPQSFQDILLGGLATDGGLVVPESVPVIDRETLQAWRGLSYPALAFEVLRLYVTDIEADDLRGIIDRTYTPERFGSRDIVPVSTLDDTPGHGPLRLLHLSNGPTRAFKDIAMQLLGELFQFVLARQDRHLNILGATSGDTGSAAEYAMRGKANVRVFMLSPHGRMSKFQRAQMYSLLDENIHNIVVPGFFDDCQDLVKAVSNDLRFKERYAIGTVNSINWARVIAQVVYYFHGYFRSTSTNDEFVDYTVPTGNFGNVLAGHIARSMGLPIRRLVVATNENDVLDEFFRTGRYRVRTTAETYETSSPSMDISKASNFERYVFDLVGRNPQRLADLYRQIDREGLFDLAGQPAFEAVVPTGFTSGSSTHADRVATIRHWHQTRGVLIDPHTADAVCVAQRHRDPSVPMICLETALPLKFAETVVEATGRQPPMPESLAALEGRVQRYSWMPADVTQLKRYIASHAVPATGAGHAAA